MDSEVLLSVMGLSLCLTEDEQACLSADSFHPVYENKTLLRENGMEIHSDIPAFPWE